ncbi:MAG: hypothetical protein ACN4GT_04045 [Gammaproteobacteria bacterium]
MNRARHLGVPVTLMSLLVLLFGCSDGEDRPAKTEAEKRQALEESAFGDMTSTLDRAKEVEDLGADRKRQLDEELEK